MKATLLYMFLCIGQFAIAQTKEILTNKSILELAKAGLSKEVIVSKIETTGGNFDVSTNGIIALKKANIDDAVIKAMIGKSNTPIATVPTKYTTNTKPTELKKEAIPSIPNIQHPYAWIKSKNTTLLLEKNTASVKAKMKLLGMGGISTSYEAAGTSSPIRINANDSLSFIINTGNNNMLEMTLYKLTINQGKRGAKVSTTQGMIKKKGELDNDAISFTINQLKASVFEIVPSKKLEKGEYYFGCKPTVNGATIDVFAFGID